MAMAFLKKCPLTQGLATRTLHMLNVELERGEQASDSCFYLEGQAASGLYIIQEGTVKVYRNKRADELPGAKGPSSPRPQQGAMLGGSRPPSAAPAGTSAAAASDATQEKQTSEAKASLASHFACVFANHRIWA